jgi:cytochrome c oxidase subunit II
VAVGRRRGARRLAGLALLSAVLLGTLSACSVQDAFHFGWPRGVTPQSHRMFDLWIGSAIAALSVGVFVWGLIFWCVVRYRKRGDRLPPQTRYNMPIELIYTVAPFLIISVLFYYTAIIQTDVNRNTATPAVTVDVTSFQWNWKFEYEGTKDPAGAKVNTIGQDNYIPVLVVPTNETIRFILHSNDVIHSFWVPEMLFKRDVFPGNTVNEFETTIQSEGAYVGRCAELCGTYHSMMNFEVRAVTPAKFDQYLALRAQGQSTPDALRAIGEEPFATTTKPFPTKRANA